VARLLDLSRIESGILQPLRDWHDVEEILAGVAERLDPPGERVRLQVAEALPLARVDYVMVEQIVTNLVDNALKYSEPSAEVEVAVRELPDAVEATVSDRGVGIDDVTAKRMFDAFGRGDRVDHVPGLGLGLHISQQIVERHGGTISASPRADGRGTSFTVRLPRTQDETAP
jgi:two-component system sensor histidine kinase KdpD